MLIECENVEKKFPLPSGEGETTVLRDVSLQVSEGEALSVIGPSGSGKSTLLNLIGTLDRPTGGRIMLNGRNLSDLGDGELSVIRNREIGFVFQLHHLLPQCTVLENVLIPTLPFGRKVDQTGKENRARELLERVGLGAHTGHFPAQLSGGELQRTAVVRALINEPKVVLADEPTGSLDKKASENLGRLLMELNREKNVALIIVTHSTDLAGMTNTVYRLLDGVLVK